MNVSRRDLLKLTLGLATVSAAGIDSTLLAADDKPKGKGKGKGKGKSQKKIPLGLQLYSVREDCKKDLPGVLKAVAGMGYQGVEFAGYYDRTAEQLCKLLDENNLKCCGTHIQLGALQGDELKKTIEFNKTIGNKYLVVSYMGEDRMGTMEKVLATAKLFNELAAKVKAEGMLVGYHAHAGDFKKLDGQTAWEIFFANTAPEVIMQLDIGNTMDGGGDPYAMLAKFPGRSTTIHLKEHGGPKGAAVGEGDVKWKEVFGMVEGAGKTDWYIVEQESYGSTTPLEASRKCIENLKKMGK